jgi:transposase
MSHEPQAGRKQISGPDKLAILQAYLVERKSIADLCDEHGLQPSQIYYWQRQLFEQGAAVFDRKPGRKGQAASAEARQIAKLETIIAKQELKLADKNEVISELMEENVKAKKASGEL